MNYHLLGFLKKVALCLAVVLGEGSLAAQFSLLYVLLGAVLLVTLLAQPFRVPALNLLRVLTDLLVIGLVAVIQIAHEFLEDLDGRRDEEYSSEEL